MTPTIQLEQKLRNTVVGFCLELFDYLDVSCSKEEIVFDYCKYDGTSIEAELYVKGVEKFKKDIFYEVVDFLQMKGEVKLERKTQKNQRIYVKFDCQIG